MAQRSLKVLNLALTALFGLNSTLREGLSVGSAILRTRDLSTVLRVKLGTILMSEMDIGSMPALERNLTPRSERRDGDLTGTDVRRDSSSTSSSREDTGGGQMIRRLLLVKPHSALRLKLSQDRVLLNTNRRAELLILLKLHDLLILLNGNLLNLGLKINNDFINEYQLLDLLLILLINRLNCLHTVHLCVDGPWTPG